MNRGTCVALALLLAVPSIAGAQRAEPKPGAQAAAAGEKKGTDAPSARKTATKKGAKAKEPETPQVSQQARSLARRTKSIYIFAQDSCARAGSKCEPTLRDDAEVRFLHACGACNTAARCEAERDAVRGGKARASKDPCAP
jgi:hypothetical protein